MVLGTVGSRYAEAIMLRNKNRAVSIVVVEGPSDSRVYKRLLKRDNLHIAWLEGKDNALKLLEKFKGARISGVVGIIDADEDRYLGRHRQAPNVCWTSRGDLESMVFSSDAYLRTPVLHLISEDVRAAHRDALIAASVPIGCIRLISKLEGWALDFKDLTFGTFIDSAKVSCDLDACCEEVLVKNLQFSIGQRELATRVRELIGQLADPFLVINGHDICRIAHLCSQRLFRRSLSGAANTFQVVAENYGLCDFAATSTHAELRAWESSAGQYTVTIKESSCEDAT